MTTFGAIGIAGTGMTVDRKWLDAVSDNLSNIGNNRLLIATQVFRNEPYK